VGLFGRLGSGNIGNDGTLEAMLRYLEIEQPDAVVDAMCSGPDEVTARFGIPARYLHWNHSPSPGGRSVPVMLGKLTRITVGAVIDTWRTALWVGAHDVVIVPGMGSLEASLQIRPWEMPYSLFLLATAGRLLGTKVAMVSVGATRIPQRVSRWLMLAAARQSTYRSFRDEYSRDEMQKMGVDVSMDEVYPDLVFALTTPPDSPHGARDVGVGVMAYFGPSNARRWSAEILQTYVTNIELLVTWLVASGYTVRLVTGDSADEPVAERILSDLAQEHPNLTPGAVTFVPTRSIEALMEQMGFVELVVATRYHNVLCALTCGKPAISVGYGVKHDALMTSMGLGEYCHQLRSMDLEVLKEQFSKLQAASDELKATLATHNQENQERVAHQFELLSATLFAPAGQSRTTTR
jgi:polysaccharide pyruvyl transferase WcaK-like protein